MKIAIPRFGDDIAPCFEYTAVVSIFTVEKGLVTRQLDFPFRSRDPLDRVRLLRDQHVDTVICGGIRNIYENLLSANGITVISRLTGTVSGLLENYLEGRLLAPGKRRAFTETHNLKHPESHVNEIGSPPDD